MYKESDFQHFYRLAHDLTNNSQMAYEVVQVTLEQLLKNERLTFEKQEFEKQIPSTFKSYFENDQSVAYDENSFGSLNKKQLEDLINRQRSRYKEKVNVENEHYNKTIKSINRFKSRMNRTIVRIAFAMILFYGGTKFINHKRFEAKLIDEILNFNKTASSIEMTTLPLEEFYTQKKLDLNFKILVPEDLRVAKFLGGEAVVISGLKGIKSNYLDKRGRLISLFQLDRQNLKFKAVTKIKGKTKLKMWLNQDSILTLVEL